MRLDHFRIVFTLLALSAGCGSGNTSPPAPLANPSKSTGSETTHNELIRNALEVRALTRNQEFRLRIAAGPLNTATVLQALQGQLLENDRNTEELAHYIVTCALDSTQEVEYPGREPWKGELGLCHDWHSVAPSPECLQLVSSCVLSRVNLKGHRVVISLRGPSDSQEQNGTQSGFFDMKPQVGVETTLREKDDKGNTYDIVSFGSCSGTEPAGTTRDCGWKALDVGMCTAGTQVRVCPSDADQMVRVCKGLHGCNDIDFSPSVLYAGTIAEQQVDPSCGGVLFTCPNNGPGIGSPTSSSRYGYFSVMSAYQDPMRIPDGSLAATAELSGDPSSDSVEYPAGEERVFTYREGAFYGNIFSVLPAESDIDSRVLGGDMYACYGEEWSCGLAHLTDRFCAGAGADVTAPCQPGSWTGINEPCFVNVPEKCHDLDPTAMRACNSADGSPGRYYDGCLGAANQPAWAYPISVYLNHPCDLSTDGNCNFSSIFDAFIPPQ